MSQSLSSLASLLKENVRAGVADVAFRRTDFLNILGDAGRVEDSTGSAPFEWQIATSGNTSVEVFSEGQAPPIAGAQTYKRPSLSPFYVRGVFGWSGHARDNNAKRGYYESLPTIEAALTESDVLKKLEDTILNATQDQGIASIIDSTGTYAGLSQGSVSQWASEENNVGGVLTLASMQDLYEEMVSPAGGSSVPRGAVPTHWLMPVNQVGNYVSLGGSPGATNAAYRFRSGDVMDLSLAQKGWTGMSFMGLPIMTVSGITSTEIYLIDVTDMAFIVHRSVEVKPIVGNVEMDQFQVSIGGALRVNRRNHHGKLTGVTA